MFKFLFLLFLVVPLLEIYLLLSIGGVIGVFPTVGLVVLTAVLGGALIRLQGLGVLFRLRERVSRAEIPANEILTGTILLVAGALLLTPGFFTDTIGFLLLVPPLRQRLIVMVARGLLLQKAGQFRKTTGYTYSSNGKVIDNQEFIDKD